MECSINVKEIMSLVNSVPGAFCRLAALFCLFAVNRVQLIKGLFLLINFCFVDSMTLYGHGMSLFLDKSAGSEFCFV